MTQKDALYAATFSLLMPGLGQLYTHRLVPGVGFFMIFATLLAIPALRFGIPLLVVLAALEGYFSLKAARQEGSSWRTGEISYWKSQSDPYRLPLFLFASLLGGIGWVFLLFPMLSPVGAQADMNDRVDRLAKSVYEYRARHGMAPQNLEVSLKEQRMESLLPDPWGNPYVLEMAERGFLIRSLGRDGRYGTSDDSLYSFP